MLLGQMQERAKLMVEFWLILNDIIMKMVVIVMW
jgi:hypothetical protein